MHNNLHYYTIMLTHNFFFLKSDIKLEASTSLRKSVFPDPKLFESVELPLKVTLEFFLFLFYLILFFLGRCGVDSQ